MNKKGIKIVCIVMICIIACLAIYPFLYSYFCKHRVYTEISGKISDEILSANIEIIKQTQKEESIGYSTGFGGVIFKHTGNKYYVLTAYHAVKPLNNSKFIALAYNEPNYREYMLTKAKYIGISGYYERFPFANVEYYDEKYDLAILSFESDANLNALDIADKPPQYGDKVVVISSPYGEGRNMITYGKVTSRSPIKFNDDTENMEYKMIKHSAYINKGSSGSAVMNKNLEIVGINLGGATNIFGKYGYGMAMPSDKINDFIAQWNNSQ